MVAACGPVRSYARHVRARWPLLVLLVPVLGCGGDAAAENIAGTYAVTATNGSNTCGFQPWVAGDSSTGLVQIFETTRGGAMFAVQGPTGVLVNFITLNLGNSGMAFPSSVSGSTLVGSTHGELKQTLGACTYTIDATVNATVTGTSITGAITYTPVPQGAGCDALNGCSQAQSFTGVRQ